MADAVDPFFSSLSRRNKIAVTAVLCYSNTMLGVCLNFLGPCLDHFNWKLGEETSTTSIVFSIQTGCYVAGSFLYLLTARFTGRHLGSIFYLSMFALPTFVFPFLTSKWPFYIMGGVIGLGVGGYDPAQIAWIIDLWGRESGPYILGQHFFYSLGTVIPPLLLAPFVPDYTEQQGTTTTPSPVEQDKLFIPFTIGGVLACVAILAQIVLYIHLGRIRRRMRADKRVEQTEGEIEVAPSNNQQNGEVHEDPRIGKWLVLLTCLFIAGYQGMEMDNLQFMHTYATSANPRVDSQYAANVVSALTGAFAVGRLVGIVAVLKVRPEFILVTNFVFTIAGTLTLFFMGISKALLWAGAVLLGVGFSTTYPGYFAYIEKHMVVNDFRAALVTMSGSFVAFVYPFIVGDAIEENPKIMNYVTFGSLAAMFVTFSIIYFLTKGTGPRK